VKNIYLFIIFLFLTGCGYNLTSNTKISDISCPFILFGSDHKVYIDSSSKDISLDNIEYQGELNNAIFNKKCTREDNIFSSELSILFILQPLVDKVNSVDMPFYIAILNQNKKLQDMLYFSVSGKFKKDLETKKIIETEATKTLILQHESINQDSIIVIGFVLDKKRKEILN
tara:strand:- start:544 stop:1059 length:516 start_codon:yes stop_codon:yes gene_type:complete